MRLRHESMHVYAPPVRIIYAPPYVLVYNYSVRPSGRVSPLWRDYDVRAPAFLRLGRDYEVFLRVAFFLEVFEHTPFLLGEPIGNAWILG